MGKGVNACEFFEEHGLAFHHGQRGGGADVAQAEHRRAVGDDGDAVALDGQVVGFAGVFGNRRADAGDAGRVGARQIGARFG
jgi:hypothetical protein